VYEEQVTSGESHPDRDAPCDGYGPMSGSFYTEETTDILEVKAVDTSAGGAFQYSNEFN
jgi:hypothetical protein